MRPMNASNWIASLLPVLALAPVVGRAAEVDTNKLRLMYNF
jgi:hypothetical protein